jgi:chromosome segregation ATPase
MDKKLVVSVVENLNKKTNALAKELDGTIKKIEKLETEINTKNQEANDFGRKQDQMKQQKEVAGQLLSQVKLLHPDIKRLAKIYPYSLEEIDSQLTARDEEKENLNQAIGRPKGAKEVSAKMDTQEL